MSSGLEELTARAYDLVAAGELGPARTALEEGLSESAPDGDTVPPDLAEAASLYARVLLACAEPAAAAEWAAYAHGAAGRLHGADDERTIRDAATLAAALYRVGEFTDAERLYRDVVARLTASDGPGSPHALAARADLATVLHATGQCRAARSELAGALAARQAGYGLDDPAGIRMLARLAAMSRDCGDETSAQRHFARARALAEAYLPADHPVMAQVAALTVAPANAAHPCDAGAAPGSDPTGSQTTGPAWTATDSTTTGPAWTATDSTTTEPTAGPSTGTDPRTVGHVPGPRTADPAGPNGAAADAGTTGPAANPEVRPGAGRPLSRGHLAAPRRLPVAGHLPMMHPADPPDTPPAGSHPSGGVVPDNGRPRYAGDADGVWPQHRAAAGYDDGVWGTDPGSGYDDGRSGRDAGAPTPAGPDTARTPAHLEPFRAGAAGSGELATGSPGHRYLYDDGPEVHGRSRSRWVWVAFGTGLAMLGVAGGWFAATQLTGGAGPDPGPATMSTREPGAGSPGAAPPSGVRLRDGRDSVTLTWTYPKGAEGPVLVAGGRAGEEQRAFHTLEPGSTSYTVYSLAEGGDYCFTVAVVYSTDVVARSEPVCTDRKGKTRPAR